MMDLIPTIATALVALAFGVLIGLEARRHQVRNLSDIIGGKNDQLRRMGRENAEFRAAEQKRVAQRNKALAAAREANAAKAAKKAG